MLDTIPHLQSKAFPALACGETAGREAIGGGKQAIEKDLQALALLATALFLPRLVSLLRHKS